MTDGSLQFAPAILRRLGEELVPRPDQGLLELVKNAYDADATKCTIRIFNENGEPSISIADDGVGMTSSQISQSWLVLGASEKTRKLTPKFHRVPAGDKGLGRLAALRLGSSAVLISRPEVEPGIEYSAVLDWEAFENVRTVEQVSIPISVGKTRRKPGTEVVIKNLRKRLSKSDAQHLARSLLLMSDPFDSVTGFKTSLNSDAFKDLSARVADGYFDEAVYHLTAELSAEGLATFVAKDKSGKVLWEENSSETYQTVPAQFELWVFLLDGKHFARSTTSVKEVRNWLGVTGGVHIYEDGIRVAPYGGASNDVLQMNVQRAKNPEERPSTNNAIGIIRVDNSDNVLVQKTDRNGYVETDAFVELVRFGEDALSWLASRRIRVAEERRKSEKKKSKAKSEKADRELNIALDNARTNTANATDVERAVRKAVAAKERQVKMLEQELVLYRSLATAGIAASVFSHEVAAPISQVDRIVKMIRKKMSKSAADDISILFEQIAAAQAKLLNLARIPLHLLTKDKRRVTTIDIHSVVTDLVGSYQAILVEENILCDVNLSAQKFRLRTSVANIEGILTNFLVNSIKAFNRVGPQSRERNVVISTSNTEEFFLLSFADSGPGIRESQIEDVWLPGVSSDEGDLATGFGLTIVKDTVQDMGGEINLLGQGDLGGAQFEVLLPIEH